MTTRCPGAPINNIDASVLGQHSCLSKLAITSIYIYIAILRLDGLHGLPSLKALIAARNEIAILEGLTPKKNPMLETVVLSHNHLESVSLTGREVIWEGL